MSDIPDDGPSPPTGLWRRYRAAPLALQILVPVLVVALVLVVVVVWAASSGSDDATESATTEGTGAELDAVLKGIVLVGGLASSGAGSTASAATTATTATTAAAETTPATHPAATTAATTTTAAAATTTSTTTPRTTATPTTAVTTSTPLTTITSPDTTAAPTTTAAPSTTLPTTSAFFAQWNDATGGTDVPAISASQATELTGQYAGYYLITLTPEGSELPPQVGLVGTLTSPGSGELAQLLLVWIPGADETSSDFFWEAFGVLTHAVTPDITADETAALATSLGRAPGRPPFTTAAEATAGGLDYRQSSRTYEGAGGPIDVSGIAVLSGSGGG
jgi:hypothetical protein